MTDHQYGVLRVEGDVLWTGGWYFPYVNASANADGSNESTVSDLWYSTKTFTVSGAVGANNGARIDPRLGHLPPGGAGQIRVGRTWKVIEAETKIVLQPNAVNPPVHGSFALEPEVANPVKKWYVKRT